MPATPLNIQRADQGLPAFDYEPGGGWQLLDKPSHIVEDQSMFMVVTLVLSSLQDLLTMEYFLSQLNMCPISLLLFLPHPPPEVTLPLKLLQLQVLTLPIMNTQLTMPLHILFT